MKRFEPIAIIGQGCILPGCASPSELWDTVYNGRVNITSAAEDAWRIDMRDVLMSVKDTSTANKTWHNKGGYINDFGPVTDLNLGDFSMDELDVVFQWSIYAAHQALDSAGYGHHEVTGRAGLVMGNLSYPTRSVSRLFEESWLKDIFPGWVGAEQPISPVNRFTSGLPAILTAQALGLKGDAFAIDAACASSLYALKLACDKLHDHSTDMMLAGGVCAADQLFLHVGFTALNALSPSGQSRPFNKDADGLIPAEGAAFVVIKRLEDAVAHGDNILGVIRGIGLSNDGKAGGFLSPSKSGMVRSMVSALRQAAVKPDEVSYIECHGTGTAMGDSLEIESMKEVYANVPGLCIGSLKANLGHTITASGAAGIIKVLEAFRRQVLPPSPNAYPHNEALAGTSFCVPDKPAHWPGDKRKMAAVSNFGFGGNNAHLILEEWNPEVKYACGEERPDRQKVAIVAVELQSDKFDSANEFLKAMLKGEDAGLPLRESVSFGLKSLSFPPNDLKAALGQQLLLLRTAQNALSRDIAFDKESTGVFIGMGCDTEINRYGLRKRLKYLLEQGDTHIEQMRRNEIEEFISPVLTSAGVIGAMPNIPANRINSQFDILGMGFTVSCEELSGVQALKTAVSQIRAGLLTTAIVGAVDAGNERVNKQALAEVYNNRARASDMAVILILKDYDTAIKDGGTIFATIDDAEKREHVFSVTEDFITRCAGYSHASSGLVEVASAVLLAHHRLQMSKAGNGLRPILTTARGFSYMVRLSPAFGIESVCTIHSEPLRQPAARSQKEIFVYRFAADTKEELVFALRSGDTILEGGHRLAIIAAPEEIDPLKQKALSMLERTDATGWLSEHIFYAREGVTGEMAFVYTSSASAYGGMGRELLMEFPGLVEGMHSYWSDPSIADFVYDIRGSSDMSPGNQLAGASLISQVHSVFTKQVLRLKPAAAIGMSVGETNSILAFNIWDDMDAVIKEMAESNLFTESLGGAFKAVREYWKMRDGEEVEWECWRLIAPVGEVKNFMVKEDRAYVAIIFTDTDCTICGDKATCRRIVDAVGRGKCVQVNFQCALHCPACLPVEPEWRKIHTRNSNDNIGVRFYSSYYGRSYSTTSEQVAGALTGQAVACIDFPRIINKAWKDGVRIFVEHGPRNILFSAISRILKDKEHLCISLDKYGKSSLATAFEASAVLWCSGVEADLSALARPEKTPEEHATFSFALHKPELHFAEQFLHSATKDGQNDARLPRVLQAAPQYGVYKTGRHLPENDSPTRKPIIQAAIRESSAIGSAAAQQHDALLSLFENQHKMMFEAHEGFLNAQYEAQTGFIFFLRDKMRRMTGQLPSTSSDVEISSSGNVNSENEAQLPIHMQDRPLPETIGRRDAMAPGGHADDKISNHLPGPKLCRADLEVLASGKISSVLGQIFQRQDGYDIQVRMPEPPLLLCDRVMGIEGEPGTLGLGTIWTETDVKESSWYLHNNRMPPGIFIEAGQADLLLISWLGIDFQNKGERAYRLLGCELIFYDELPKPGDTLKYDIHVDGYAKSGETTLFFFHYDCRINDKIRISVRNGQAGFFTRQELAESKGVIWDETIAEYSVCNLPAFENATTKTAFTQADVLAYTLGDMVLCFGEELSWTQTHTRTPRSHGGYQNFIGKVPEFNLEGGPARRGYMRSENPVSPDDWFFKGHFKNDECMPGTLMADACLQMMAFYLVAAGLTTHKDGWRFEPVTGLKYKFVCRGQVTPASKKVVYEVFVDEIDAGFCPVIYAHVLATVDGTKAFLCERLGLRLTPDWPLPEMQRLFHRQRDMGVAASYHNFIYDYASLMNCALGMPGLAFGDDFAVYNSGLRSPRLPGPPYHFMTRIKEIHAVPGEYKGQPYIVSEYDIAGDEWYFGESGNGTMPYAVLMEIALQPCGWFSTFVCQRDIMGRELLFRNLDGNAVQHREVITHDGSVAVKSVLTAVSAMDAIIIVKFNVEASVAGEIVYTMTTVFGFFDADSMSAQKGLPVSGRERDNFTLLANNGVNLKSFPIKYFAESGARLPASKLLMIDRVVAIHPDGGAMGKGYLRAEKDVVASDWFFKAHFFQDPVQPGSLGVEAMLQLIQFFMIERNLHIGFTHPRFQPVSLGSNTEWHYRGQVTPEKKLISIDFDVHEIFQRSEIVTVTGEARLWVDGLKIYHAPKIAMSIVNGILTTI